MTRPEPVRRALGSAIRAAMPVVGDRDAVDLALGEPSWPLPPAARRALAVVERAGYGAHAGEPALRRAIAAFEAVDADEVLVTAGAQAALFAIVHAYLGAGNAALVPDPGFPAYRSLAALAGARAVPYALDAASGDLDAEALIAVLDRTPGARAVFLNHPANPTGGLASAHALRRVAEACDQRGVLLVADEVYRDVRCGDYVPVRLRSVTGSGLVVGSMSKAFAAPGLRLGWLLGDPALLVAVRDVHALMTTHAASASQAAALALLGARDQLLSETRRQLALRWEALERAWTDWIGDLPGLRRTSLYHWFAAEDDLELCRLARRAGVALVPGSAFGGRGRGFVRLSVGAPPEAIREGVRRLAPLLAARARSAA